MLIAAKLALGFASTIVFAGVYTFREGVIRVDVDEHHSGGSHVHFWVPAAAVPMAMHFVPKRHFRKLPPEAAECLPLVQIVTTELSHYPDTTFVDVQDDNERVRVATVGTKLQIDVVSPEENVHVAVPLSTVNDVANQLAANAPGL
ncbi:MAG TPA: hypothetical protein VIW23_04845 [Candidatus Acidoferrum sp.]|jgi:hypothetical protein